MARYTCLFTIATPMSNLHGLLSELLEACNFDIIYQTPEYMMAREVPGQIAFSKLVTVEVLIDQTAKTEDIVRMSFVIKNEELPLQVDNHCRQMFTLVNQTLAESTQLRLIDAVAG